MVHPITDHEGPEVEWRYSSTLSLTSALGGVGGQLHTTAALRYPLCKDVGRLPGPVWTGSENVAPHWDSIPGPFSP
jgi:hypothetical protein